MLDIYFSQPPSWGRSVRKRVIITSFASLYGSQLVAVSDYTYDANGNRTNPGYVTGVVEEHMARRANHRLLIWSFMCFEWWCRIFLGGERPA